jgi:hypothetical protein
MSILPKKRFRKRPETTDTTIQVPTLSLEVTPDQQIGIKMSWPKGTDLTAFSTMLTWLNQGELFKPMMQEMNRYGTSIGEGDKATASQFHIFKALQKNDADVVPPRKAIKINMRIQHG